MSFFPKHHASRVGASQTIAYDASVGIANAFSSGIYQLRLAANSACRITTGSATACRPRRPPIRFCRRM